VCAESISEADFLVTELRYTFAQLSVQLGDLNSADRRELKFEGRSAEQIFRDMIHCEEKFQAHCARLLHRAPPPEQDDIADGSREGFERKREQTVAMLTEADDWSRELVELVKQQVSEDRGFATELAEIRTMALARHRPPDVSEPISAE
jgi:hypothetical protein